MRKLTTTLATIVAVLGISMSIAGCSSDKPEKPANKQASLVLDKSLDDVFLAEMHREFPKQTVMTDETMVKLAKAGCKSLDKGFTVQEVFAAAATSARTVEIRDMAYEVLSEGIATYCPKHLKELMAVAG